MRKILTILFLAFAITVSAAPPAITTVTTYESMSLYWPWTDDLASATTSSNCTVEYRTPAGSGSWLPGLDLWQDGQNSTFSGSVVHLQPGTEYEFRLTCDSPSVQTTVIASTRSDTFPEGTVNAFGAKTAQFTITTGDSGNAGAYTVFENGTMTTANPGGVDHQLVIEDGVTHVILRNITFNGGTENCIRIGDDCTDIIIEDCYFTNWGHIGLIDSSFAADIHSNAAISTGSGPDSNLERVTIQNCEFYNSAGGAHDYTDLNPLLDEVTFTAVTDEGGGQISFTVADTTDMNERLGTDDYAPKKFGVEDSTLYDTQVGQVSYSNGSYPNLYAVDSVTATKVFVTGSFLGNDSGTLQFDDSAHTTGHHAIAFNETIGQHVIRWNKIHSPGADNMYNDALGGGANNSADKGAYGADSDIYGNEVSWAADNAIEVEGSNTNVRVWNNYVHSSRIPIASAAVNDGPLYTWKNVITECRSERENQTASSNVFKTGNTSVGRQYWFFNTVTQDGSVNGYSSCITDAGGGTVDYWYSRNNIFDVEGLIATDGATSATHDLDMDVANKVIVYTGNLQTNNYDGGTNPPSGGTGYWVGTVTFESDGPFPHCNANELSSGSIAYRGGVGVANFGMDETTRLTISDPDVGAMDSRMIPFVYGIQSGTAINITASSLTVGP